MTLKISNLSKRFMGKGVVSGVSFELKEETIYGFLGRNGAGKTTTLKMIANQLTETAGQIFLDGVDPRKDSQQQKRIYLMSTEHWLPANNSFIGIVKLLKDLNPDFDDEFAMELCQLFGLDGSKKLIKLSTGYQSVAKLIVALSVSADYVFLDEPVLGLDAAQRKKVNQALLMAYDNRPRTLVISSHLIEEVAPLLEEVIIIDRGQIKVQDTVEHLLTKGYTLTGPKHLVTELSLGKTILETSTLGKTKQVVILGDRPSQLPSEVEMTSLNLQDYLIYLTQEV
ncbi:ATP-binding cassette domain-containing protein [Streptococcus hillyeri]|uniref:ABC transporter ATP-binding protein n=1 Tax=Streptococcus hillyeri TaxID=2282420 RepID=A0A3L9DV15_9STRE|nr:ABC transporter ATP-binding protein [Streptococcus hillyeri]RLY05316.1 ABC transporter ATP-binding protein [Streptococcus hillyeri]